MPVEQMIATFWISGRKCRVFVKNDDGKVIDSNDDWNNLASAQITVQSAYPSAKFVVVRDEDQKRVLDEEWHSMESRMME